MNEYLQKIPWWLRLLVGAGLLAFVIIKTPIVAILQAVWPLLLAIIGIKLITDSAIEGAGGVKGISKALETVKALEAPEPPINAKNRPHITCPN